MKIFIDDERFPIRESDFDFVIRDHQSFIDVLSRLTVEGQKIDYVQFDHDLGELSSGSGFDCAKTLVETDIDFHVLSNNFSFYVHSMNPVGKENIINYLDSYMESKSVEGEVS